MERIGSLGVEAAVVIDFSEEMSNLSGEAFVRLLTQNLTIQRIVVGENFRFGKKRNSGTDDLRQMLSGTRTEVLVTPPVLRAGSVVSSSRIRTAIRAGELEEARQMLAAPHAVDLRGFGERAAEGGVLRIPRGNIDQVLPPPGDYAVSCEGPAGERPGTCHIDNESLALTTADCRGATALVFS
jgi:riboflavin kinase/FMN adenylyltransferase